MKKRILSAMLVIIVCAVFCAPTMGEATIWGAGGGNATKVWVEAESLIYDYLTVSFSVYMVVAGQEYLWNSASGSGYGYTIRVTKNDNHYSGYYYNVYFTATARDSHEQTSGSFSFKP